MSRDDIRQNDTGKTVRRWPLHAAAAHRWAAEPGTPTHYRGC